MLSDSTQEKIYVYKAPAPPNQTEVSRTRYWRELGLVAALVVAGFGVRLYNLGSQPLWFDETYNLALVEKLSFFDALTFYQPWLIHPPLFLAVMNRWMAYFGKDEFTLRLFSAIMGTGVLPVVYLIARRWINRRVALTSLLLVTLSPLQIYTSQTIRPYAWLTLLVALSMGLALFAVERPEQIWRWLVYALSVALMIYVHYLAFHAVFVEVVFFALTLYKNWKTLLRAFLSLTLAALIFLPWLPNFLEQSRHYGDSLEYLANGGIPKLVSALNFLAAWFINPVLLFAVGAVFLPLYIFGIRWLWQNWRNGAILLVGWSFLPFITCWISSLITPNFSLPRMSFCIPGFLIVIAAGVWSLIEPNKSAGPPVKSWLALALVLALSLSAILNYYQNYHNQDWRGLVNYIVAQRQPNDLIFLTNQEGTSTTGPAFSYYYDYKLGAPGNLKRSYILNKNKVAQEVPNIVKGYNRIWLVDYDINAGWQAKAVLPNIPPEYHRVFYQVYPSSDQGPITLTLLVKNP